MNIRFLITAAVAAISISVFAQKPPVGGPGHGGPGQGGGMHRGMMPPELQKELNLTPAQEKKLKAINEKFGAKMKALMGGKPPVPGQKFDRSKFKPLMDERKKETDAVLTAKQRAILEKWRATHRRPGGPGGAGGPRLPGGKSGGGTGHGG